MRIQFIMVLLAIGMMPAIARAHGLDADWKQVGEKILVEAFFDTGQAVREARVQIVDDDKKVIASGVTDAAGKCTLRAPNPGKYQLIVDAGAGHRKERSITVVGTLPPPESEPPVIAADDAAPRSDSSSRAERTGLPWDRIAIGCGVIALLGGVWW